jgi:hypothetical protein
MQYDLKLKLYIGRAIPKNDKVIMNRQVLISFYYLKMIEVVTTMYMREPYDSIFSSSFESQVD